MTSSVPGIALDIRDIARSTTDKAHCQASKTVHQVVTLAATCISEFNTWNLHGRKRADSYMLSSNFHMCAVAHTNAQTHTHRHTRTQAHMHTCKKLRPAVLTLVGQDNVQEHPLEMKAEERSEGEMWFTRECPDRWLGKALLRRSL